MGEPDLFGEIQEDEIVKIAREAVKKSGYATYEDYDEYMERKKREEGWALPEEYTLD